MIAILALLLAFCPFGGESDAYALPKAALACVAVLVAFCRGGNYVHARAKWRPWLPLTAALLVSTFFSWDLGNSLVGMTGSRGLGLFQWAVCALMFLYGCSLLPSDRDNAVVYGGWVMAALAVLQIVHTNGDRARSGSTQGSPVVLGEMLVVCFPTVARTSPATACLFMVVAAAVRCRSALAAMIAMTCYLVWKGRKPS